MTELSLTRFEDSPQLLWKNGGGKTFEIAISPPSATLDDFHWRLSIADVDQDCDFSVFHGYDRTLVLLEGDGLTLYQETDKLTSISQSSPLCSFPGEVGFHCRLTGGPTRDFNVMTRRTEFSHRVDKLQAGCGVTQTPMFLLCLSKTAQVILARETIFMSQYDLLRIEERAKFELQGECIAVTISPVNSKV